MRRTVIALVATLALAACGGGNDGEAPAGTTETEPSPTATEAPAENTGATALDGTWVAEGITQAELARTIEREGFGADELHVVLTDFSEPESLDLTWKVAAGSYTLFAAADGVDLGVADQADIVVEGDTVTFNYFSGGSSTLRWSIEGDRLEFEFIEDTQPEHRGITTAAIVAALYTSVAWEQAAS
jgi:hypothetical protein